MLLRVMPSATADTAPLVIFGSFTIQMLRGWPFVVMRTSNVNSHEVGGLASILQLSNGHPFDIDRRSR